MHPNLLGNYLTMRSQEIRKLEKRKKFSYDSQQQEFQVDFFDKNTTKLNRVKKLNICSVRDTLMIYGNLHISLVGECLRIYSLKQINFPSVQFLFDKGKFGEMPEQLSIPDKRLWLNRYYYFENFDDGIQMDFESWYSVTPEQLAKYIAGLTKGKVVVDGFCGPGGNVIQFSKTCKKVIAIDIDEDKINICKNNCAIYNCSDNIEFVKSDFLKVEGVKADYVFLSPPWGGMEYKEDSEYDIEKMMTPDINEIVAKCSTIANNLIFFLPRTTKINQIFKILETHYGLNETFLDVQILNSANKIKAVMIIFGKKVNTSELEISDMEKYVRKFPDATFNSAVTLELLLKIVGITEFLRKEQEMILRKDFTAQKLIEYLKTGLSEDQMKIFQSDFLKMKRNRFTSNYETKTNDFFFHNEKVIGRKEYLAAIRDG